MPAPNRHSGAMWRRLLIILLVAGLVPGTWLRSKLPPPSQDRTLHVTPLALDPGCCAAGPFRLAGAWHLTSHNDYFHGYSALLPVAPDRLLALSDRGYFLEFSKPGTVQQPIRIGSVFARLRELKANRDIESASWDPGSGRLWLGQEGRNSIERHRLDMARESFRAIPEMKHWPDNQGPEAMVRLADGRFVVLCECYPGWFRDGLHQGLLFGSDPSEGGVAASFLFRGIEGYRPTDMAQLPDGRVLVLMRRLVLPFPARFAGRIMIADPALIRPGAEWQGTEIADLPAPWPMDNYEGLAIERDRAGKLVAWIISDDNQAVTQRTLLLKLEIDEARLPPKQKAPGSPGRP